VLSYFISISPESGCRNFVLSKQEEIMTTIKTIAIVGASGKMGSAIARSLQGKYRLLLMSRDEAKLIDLKSELSKSTPDQEVYAVSCAREAAWEADIIIIATPYETEREVAEKIREVAVGKIVISISNPPDSQLVTSEDFSAAEQLQRQLPYSKVVKRFNTTFAADFMTSHIDGRIVDATQISIEKQL
jgi:predicted dinucleotide-binding enzyme